MVTGYWLKFVTVTEVAGWPKYPAPLVTGWPVIE
jgi:hypothetical protein